MIIQISKIPSPIIHFPPVSILGNQTNAFCIQLWVGSSLLEGQDFRHHNNTLDGCFRAVVCTAVDSCRSLKYTAPKQTLTQHLQHF